jgi:hypothetical protein
MTSKVLVRPILGFKTQLFSVLINSNKLHHTPYIVGNVIVVDRKDLEFVGKTLERKEISASIQIQG